MFGMKKAGVNAYASVGLETGVVDASPLKLVIMLYDGAITACIQAQQALAAHDVIKKGECLTKAISIIDSGLRASLNKRAGGEIAVKLDELYQYMTRTLLEANLRQNIDKVNEIQQLLMELKQAWEALEKNALTKATQNVVPLDQLVGQKTNELQQLGQFRQMAVAGA